MTGTNLTCLGCGYQTDTVECLEHPGATVKPGNLSICLNCGLLYKWDGQNWQRFTERERQKLSKEAQAWIAHLEDLRKIVIIDDLSFLQRHRKK